MELKQLKLNNNPIIMWGDNHGNWHKLIDFVNNYKITNANFIQVGDFGIGFYDYSEDSISLVQLTQFLKLHNCALYVIRGNHDNPSWFKGKHVNWQRYIYFLEDYTVLSQDDKNILCIGGAISIDRVLRKVNDRKRMFDSNFNPSWFKDEIFIYNEKLITEIIENFKTIDAVITHSRPSVFPPFEFNHLVKSYAKNDPKLLNDLQYEAYQIQSVYDHLIQFNRKPSKWFYGHFHYSTVFEIDGIAATCLDIDEFKNLIF